MATVSDFIWFFFKTKGRIGRQTYILGNLLTGVIQGLPLYRMILETEGSVGYDFWWVVFWVLFAFSLWLNFAFAIKRFHDLGQSGLFALSLFVPFISIFVFIILCILPGKKDNNRFSGKTDCCID